MAMAMAMATAIVLVLVMVCQIVSAEQVEWRVVWRVRGGLPHRWHSRLAMVAMVDVVGMVVDVVGMALVGWFEDGRGRGRL